MTDEDTRANIFQNTVVKGATGLGLGLLLGRFVFRRTVPTVLFTTGFALGMACAEAGPMLSAARPKHCPIDHRGLRPTVGFVLKEAAVEVIPRVEVAVKEIKDAAAEEVKEAVKESNTSK